MINEYVVNPHGGWIGAHGNLVFLTQSNLDLGGRWLAIEQNYYYQTDPTPRRTAMDMSSGSRITLGGTPSSLSDDYKRIYGQTRKFSDFFVDKNDPSYRIDNYNLIYVGRDLQGSVSVAEFSGDGTMDFASASGAGAKGKLDDGPKSPVILAVNTINTTSWAKTKTTIYATQHDASAFGIRSSGKMNILGDMSAEIRAFADDVTLDYYTDTTNAGAMVDGASNNTIVSGAFRVNSFSVDNRFNGYLHAQTKKFSARHYNSANYNNNEIGAYGVWSSGAVTLNDRFNGAIDTIIDGVTLSNEFHDGKDAAASKNANVNNNTIYSIGIRGTELTFHDFLRPAKTDLDTPNSTVKNTVNSIYTEVKNVTLVARSTGGDGSSSSASGNVLRSVGIYGSNLTLNGVFDGRIEARMSNIRIDNWGGATNSQGTSEYRLCGIELSDSMIANRNFGGEIVLNFTSLFPAPGVTDDNSGKPAALYNNAYGVWAQNDITVVNGYIRTNVNITVNNQRHPFISDSEYIAGFRANRITAAAYEGTITVAKVDPQTTITAGLIAADFKDSYGANDAFDVAGSITVSNSGGAPSIGILGGTTSALNIRISGDVITGNVIGNTVVNGYAVFAGWYTSKGLVTRYENQDRVEIGAGAYVRGNIDMQTDLNTLIVDSNARVWGDIISDLGRVNLEYVINSDSLGNVTSIGASQYGQQSIIKAGNDNVLASTCNVTVNLNSAEVGAYRLYEGNMGLSASQSSNGLATGWYVRSINFKYQGITSEVIEKYGIIVPPYDPSLGDAPIKVTDKGVTGRVVAGDPPLELKDASGKVYFRIWAEMVITNAATNRGYIQLHVDNLAGDAAAVKFQQLTDLATNYDRDAGIVSLNWKNPDAYVGAVYELEYRILTDGVAGKSIVKLVDGRNASLTLNNIAANQTVEWRVRQNLGQGDTVSAWREWGKNPLPGGEDIATEDPYKYICTPVSDAKYVQGESAASATSVLTWTPGDYSEGLVSYKIQYFQSTVLLDESKIDWDNVAKMEKRVSNNEIQISGLNNTEYFYWRVCAVDGSGQTSAWANGEMFRAYNEDNTPPLLTEIEPGKYVLWTESWDQDLMVPTLTWLQGTDDRSGVSRYTISYQAEGSSEWIFVADVQETGKKKYFYTLPELANGNYTWKIVVTDYVGKATEYTGTIPGDFEAPVFADTTTVSTTAWKGDGALDDFDRLVPTLSWNPAADARSGVKTYTVTWFRDGEEVGTRTVDSKTYSITLPAQANGKYTWTVTATDWVGNVSTVVDGAFEGDFNAPIFKTASVVSSVAWAGNKTITVDFSWDEASDIGSGVWSYKIEYRVSGSEGDWTVKWVDALTFNQTLKLSNANYDYRVSAFDKAGNQSEVSTGIWYGDQVAPVFEGNGSNFIVTTDYNTKTKENFVTFEWTQASDPNVNQSGTPVVVSGVEKYVITYSKGDLTDPNNPEKVYTIAVNDPNLLSVTINVKNGQLSDGKYNWMVTAYDKAGNGYGVGGNQQFTIDTTPPTGSFKWTNLHGLVTYTQLIDNSTTSSGFSQNGEASTGTTTTTNVVLSVYADITWDANFTDNLNAVYYKITFSSSKMFNNGSEISFISTDTTTNSFRLDNTAGHGIGALASFGAGKDIYMRIEAIDSVGNSSGIYSQTMPFKFIDENGNIILDTDVPTAVSITSILSTKSSVEATWTESSDIFGVKGYEVELKSGKNTLTYKVENSAELAKVTKGIADGQYSIRVRAYDYVGHVSAWSDRNYVTVDVTAPVFDANSISVRVSNTDVFFSWSPAVDNIELAGYVLEVRYNGDTDDKAQKYYIPAGSTSYALYGYANSMYTYRIWAVDAMGNASEPSKDKHFTVHGEDNPTEEKNLEWGVANPDTVGGSDPLDIYVLNLDKAAKVTLSFKDISALDGKDVGIKVTITDRLGKKLKTMTIKSSKDIENLLLDKGTYYVTIVSGKGDTTEQYTLTGNKVEEYPWSPNVNFDSAETIALDKNGNGKYEGGWVGFGDPRDYYAVDSDGRSGKLNVTVNAAGRVKVMLVDKLTGKTLKTVTVTGYKQDIFKGGVLIPSSSAYIVVESADKGKGKQNAGYDITVNNAYFKDPSVYYDWNNAGSITMTENADASFSGSVTGWVGYESWQGDHYKVDPANSGLVTVSISGMAAGQNLKVTLFDSNFKRIGTVTVKGDTDNIFKKGLLVAGGAYILVESGDKGKGKYNSDYTLTVNETYFPAATLDDNDMLTTKSVIQVGDTFASTAGWVGFGDAINWHKFEFTGAGLAQLSINGVEAGQTLKVTAYDINGKKIKNWTVKGDQYLFSDPTLQKGAWFISVESGDKGKGKYNSDYRLQVVSDNIFTPEADPNQVVALDFAGSSKAEARNEWVAYNDTKDFFSFELDKAGKVDLDLNLLDGSNARFGKDLKVKLYDASGNEVKLDGALTTVDDLVAGMKYSVAVELSNPEKYWANYNLSVTKLA